MAFNRGRPPRFRQRLSSNPRFVRARVIVGGWAGDGTDRYVRLGFVVFFLVLLVALVALLAGGSAHTSTRNELTANRAELTTPAPAATGAGGSIPGLRPSAADDNDRPDLAERLAPGFPGGIHIDQLAATLALAPGFPGGLKIGSAVLASEPPPTGAPAASPTPAALVGVPPGAIPTPPALVGVPAPGGAVTTAPVPAASSLNPAAAAFPAGSTGIPSSPPIAAAPPPAPISIAVPAAPIEIGAAPSGLPAPPIIIPPVGDSSGASDLPAPPLPDGQLPAAGKLSGPPAAPQAAMTLDGTVLSHQGMPMTSPRVQAISGRTVCADETAADVAAVSVQLTLPGACADLGAGSPLAFRAAGFEARSGLIVSPAPSCAVNGDTQSAAGGSSAPVLFQPGTAGQRVYLLLGAAQPSASCPHDELNNTGAMLLSVSVRTAAAADPLTSPVVRVAVAGKQCAEGASSGSTVAHVSLPTGCGKPGDLLTFEVAGQDGSGATPALLAACSYEFGFSGGNQPTPLYQPIAFAPGLRSASVILAALPDCPDAAAQPAATPAAMAMSLRLSVIDPTLPGSPFARPTVTAFVAGVPCVRASSVDTQEVVLTVPQACGAAGSSVSFRVLSPDPRFASANSADVPACAIDLPAGGTTAGSFRPVVRQIALRPASLSVSFGLLSADAVCAVTAIPTPAPSATAAVSASPSAAATPAPAPSPATAAPPATPSPVPATPAVGTAAAEPASGAAAGTATGTPSPTPTPVEVHGPDQVVTGVPGSNPR